MKKLKKIIYVSIVGASFVVLMVRNKNLPIGERIQVSVKGSLGVVGMSLALRFGQYNERGFVNDGFRGNESSIVCTNSSTQDSTQSLTRQKSELSSSSSSDELEALGFGNGEKNHEKEVRLVVGIPMPHSSQRMVSFQQENLKESIEESNLPLHVEQDPKIVMSRSKCDLRNPRWSKEFISSLKGGAQKLDEELIKSILSKLDDSSLSTESVNKLLMRLGNAACSILSNQDLVRILAELEKPLRYDPFSGIPVLPSLDILGFPPAEGFAPSTTSLSPYQQRVKAHVLAAKKTIVNRMEENPALVRESKRMKDQAAQRDINNLIKQLSLGNENPGIGTKRVKGLKNVSEARARNEGRVYFREKKWKDRNSSNI